MSPESFAFLFLFNILFIFAKKNHILYAYQPIQDVSA